MNDLPLPMGAFIRIGTNPRIYEHPLSLDQALSRIQSWMDQPCVRVVQPTERHWTVFRTMLREGQATANLVADAHLAAVALTCRLTLVTRNTHDFQRAGVRVFNPFS
jgi:predicted nucleic acid-binding protein